MGSEADNEIPDTGAVFTFGASGFADNLPSHFFIRNDPIIDLACGEEHTMVICQNGRLFGFGGNEYGQVGLGHNNTVSKPSCVKSLKPEKVRLIACGQHHTIACIESYKLFGWGSDSEGQVGIGENSDGEDKLLPVKCDEGVVFKSRIKQLAAGSVHSVALTSDGCVYVWGSNQKGQLGMGDAVKRTKSPSLLPLKENIVQIACGHYHTLLLSDQGQIFAFGEGDSGKLGLGGDNSVPLPIPLSMDDLSSRVVSICAGGDYSMALTEESSVYAWGDNEVEQLGFRREEFTQVYRPMVVSSLTSVSVKEIICGHHHTAFISDKNELYTCGDTHHGKLCSDGEFEGNSTKIRCSLPFKVSKFKGFKVEKVACGGKQTMVLASPDKYSNNVLPNGFSEHVAVSIVEHNISNNFPIISLELPSDREIISPPPAKTNQPLLTVPVTHDDDEETAEQMNENSSNNPFECSTPPPETQSSLNSSPNKFRTHNHSSSNINNNNNNNRNDKSENIMEIINVSDDSISSSTKSDETVSTKQICHDHGDNIINHNIDFVNNSGKYSPGKREVLSNNYFKRNLPRVIYKEKQVHHKFCYSINSCCSNDENDGNKIDEKNSVNYVYKNKNMSADDDRIDEFNDFDDSEDDDFDGINNDCDPNRYNFNKLVGRKCHHIEKFQKCRNNKFEDVNAIEEVEEEDDGYNDYTKGSIYRINNTNRKYDHLNVINNHNISKLKDRNVSAKEYLLNNTSCNNSELKCKLVPKIICFYETADPHSYCSENCIKRKSIQWFKDSDLKKSVEEKQRRKVIERWLEENELKEFPRDRRENRIKLRCDKRHRSDNGFKGKGNGDFFHKGVGKGGGNGTKGGIINHLQKTGPFFQLKSITGRKNKKDQVTTVSSEKTLNLETSDPSKTTHQNQSTSPKEVKSDSMLSRIFGNKRVTKSNNHSAPIEFEQNGSSNGVQDEDCTESNEVGNVSSDNQRRQQRPNVSTNGASRGHHKNSRMCAIL